MHTLSELMPMMKCEPDGSSTYDVYSYENNPEKRSFAAIKKDENVHMQGYYTFMDYICKNGYADEENVFVYEYDGRMDALTLADELHSFVKRVKEYTQKDKVRLFGVSYGGQIALTYLHFYLNDGDVEKAVFAAPTFKGTTFAERLLCGRVDFALDDVIDIAESIMGSDTDFGRALKDVNQERFSRILNAVSEGNSEYAKYWGAAYSMSTVEDYEVLKKTFLDEEESAEIIRKNDIIHYEVMPRVKSTLEECIAQGTDIAIYACSGIEMAMGGEENSDLLLAVEDVTGAVAAPLGKSFAVGYRGKGTSCKNRDHCHISPTGEIDATTAYLPEKTWFSDGAHHAMFQYEKYGAELAARLLCTDGLKDVHTDSEFPQFMYSTNPHRGIYAEFNNSLPGYMSPSDSCLTVENLYKENEIRIISVKAEGADISFTLENPVRLLPGEKAELSFEGALPENAFRTGITIEYIKDDSIDILCDRELVFTYYGSGGSTDGELVVNDFYNGDSSGMSFFKRILYTFIYCIDILHVLKSFFMSDAFRYLL